MKPYLPYRPYQPYLAGSGPTELRASSGLVVDANTVRVQFSGCVDISAVTGIQVKIGAAAWEVVAAVASGSEKVWEFTTTTAIAEGDTVLWQYLGGEDSIVDCVESVDVGALGPKTVTNGLELTAPTIVSIEVGTVVGNVFVFAYDEEVASTDFTLGWTIEAAETALTLESATVVSPGVVHVTTTESVYEGQEVLASYDADVGDIVDVSGYPDGNALASITDEAVTNNVVLASLVITPDASTIDAGDTQQFTATGTYNNGGTLDITADVTWDSSNDSFATIAANGLATGVAEGSVTITATLGAISDNTTLAVEESAVTLVSIAITPNATTIVEGATQQFTATGTYSDASTADITATVTWDSSNDALATITAGGLATGVGYGQATISATLGAISDTTTLDIAAVPLWTRDLTTLAVGADATFARASTAHHTQPDSLITQISTTEARFSGARRVANILRSSENLLTLEWAAPVNATVVGGVSDPLGGTTAYTLTATATNGVLRQTNTYIPSQTGLAAACGTSIWIRRRTGTGVISLYNPQTSVNITASVTGSWQRLFLFTTTVSTPQFFLSLATSGDATDIWHPMISSHSVASPLPPEYVSTGVPTGPNVATNGTFDSDTGWTKGTGWTITGGVAVATATTGDLTLPLGTFTPVVGKTYFVSFDVVVTSGLVRPPFKTTAGDNISASGSYSYTYTATVTTAVAFDGVTSFTGTIDNVVIQECVGQANADGVQYFATANGNTVDGSHVVTEAKGAALPGPFGLLMEPAATNLCLQSQVAGTTWMQTNVTIAADSEAAPNGSLTADTLTAAAGDATWTQAVTAASADRTWSLWIKRKTGTGTISMSLDGGSTYTTKTITADWARYSITQTLANPSMMLKITTNADAVYVWGSQLEAGSIATSYIPTTTVAVTRAVDSLSYTGVPADNETRFVIDAANVDTDDWNGTMAPPTNPDVLSSIAVYAPEARP